MSKLKENKITQNSEIAYKNFKLASTYTMRGKTVSVDKYGIFNILPTRKKINANNVSFGGKYPYVARGEGRNGIRGYIDFDEQYLNPGNTIAFGQDTATMNYQSVPYFTGDKIQIFELNTRYGSLKEDIALYLIAAVRKAFANFSWGQQSFALDVISDMEITLPVDSKGNLDLQYMQDQIAELEQEHIAELDAYLKASGLDDYELTPEDKEVLSLPKGSTPYEADAVETDIHKQQVRFKKFVMHDIFELLQVKKAKKSDVKDFWSEEYCVPVVYAKFGNNGIMYWGRKGEFTTYKNVISIVYNGAISAGKVYAQKEPTGILAESYLIRYKYGEVPFLANLYISQVIEHKIYPLYSRDTLAIWNGRVENETIELPITESGDIDFDYMELYIRALEKLTIAEVVKYKDKVIKSTRRAIAKQ